MTRAKPFKRNSGAILVLTALISAFVLGITALVVDIGYLYYKGNALQTAVNASWLGGNDRLMKLRSLNPVLTQEGKEDIKSHVREIMLHNGFEAGSEEGVDVEIEGDRDLFVSAKSHVGLFFARIIKADSTTIASSRGGEQEFASSADILPIVMSHGIMKWNIDKKLTFEFFGKNDGFILGNEYIIKPGQLSETSLLCQGIANFGAEKAFLPAAYEENLSLGYTNILNLNDKTDLLCGGFLAETQNAIEKRLAAPMSSRRVIIPLAEPSVEIASDYGVEAASLPICSLRSKGTAVSYKEPKIIRNAARIIGFAKFELVSDKEYKRIGTNYELGDKGSLGSPALGQIRGNFLGYIVNPNETDL